MKSELHLMRCYHPADRHLTKKYTELRQLKRKTINYEKTASKMNSPSAKGAIKVVTGKKRCGNTHLPCSSPGTNRSQLLQRTKSSGYHGAPMKHSGRERTSFDEETKQAPRKDN